MSLGFKKAEVRAGDKFWNHIILLIVEEKKMDLEEKRSEEENLALQM